MTRGRDDSRPPSGAPPNLLKYRYDLVAQLADSPAWDTWRGYDRVHGETVLIKVVNPAHTADERAARKWMQRLGAQRGYPLPHGAEVLDVGRDHERYYYVREFVEGPTLERWMTQQQDPDVVLACAVIILQCLARWHADGFVHGQLHPANIVLHDSGPAICDHDFQAATKACLGVSAVRRKHQVYLAPEVTAGMAATPESDVYSIGVALFELLTGRKLGSDVTGVPAASSLNPALPAGVDVVLEGMLRPNPEDRYPAAHAAEALSRLRGQAEEQVEQTPRERRRQRVRERREAARKPLPWPVTVTLVFYRFLFIMLFTGLVSMATLAGMGYSAYRYLVGSIPAEVIIPDVVGKPAEQAQALFEKDLNLHLVVKERQASPKVPAGAIIGTRPEAGRRVREGRTIDAVVSSGLENVTVPSLIESTLADAQKALSKLGLKLGVQQKISHPTLPANAVVAQDPGPGRKVPPGSTVNLKISTGPPAEPSAEGEETKEPAADTQVLPKRVGRVKITMPTTPRQTTVKIVVRDADGERVVCDEVRYAGDVVMKVVEGRGETVVEVFLNGQKVETRVL